MRMVVSIFVYLSPPAPPPPPPPATKLPHATDLHGGSFLTWTSQSSVPGLRGSVGG